MVEWAGVLGKCKGSIKTAYTGVAAGSDKMISIYQVNGLYLPR